MVGCTNSQGVFNCTCTHTQILARSHTHTQLRQTPKGDLGSSSFALGRVYDDSQDSGRTCASPTVSEEYNSLRITPTALGRFYGLKRLRCVKLCHLLVIGWPIVGGINTYAMDYARILVICFCRYPHLCVISTCVVQTCICDGRSRHYVPSGKYLDQQICCRQSTWNTCVLVVPRS